MWWIVFALVPLIIDSFSNLFDSYFVNRGFRDPVIFMFYLSILEILFLPLIFFYQLPFFVNFKTLFLFVLIALADLIYILFYLKALQKDDTSIVISLFSLGKITVPFLAFFILGERLKLIQYIGFFVIISCASILTYQPKEKLRFNKAAFFMLISSVFGSLEGVILKAALGGVDWVTGYTYLIFFSFASLFVFVLLFRRKQFSESLPFFRRNLFTFGGMGFLNFVSSVSGILAISLASITIIKGIWAVQPLLVLVLSLFLAKYYPGIIKEKLDGKNLVKKFVLFLVIILALVLTLRY